MFLLIPHNISDGASKLPVKRNYFHGPDIKIL